MNKRNIAIIIIIIAVLTVAIIYFFKKNQVKSEEVVISDNSQNEQSLEDINNEEKIGNTQQDQTVAGVTASVAIAGENVKYNSAMKSAQKAFIGSRYNEAISYYKTALKYSESDAAYAGLYIIYTAQNRWPDAELMLDKAIAINPEYTDYYKWKIGIMDEKTEATFDNLKTVYEDALTKVNPETKINLVTYFAGVAERNGQYSYAVSYWQHAILLYPGNTEIYQAEIDRLKAI